MGHATGSKTTRKQGKDTYQDVFKNENSSETVVHKNYKVHLTKKVSNNQNNTAQCQTDMDEPDNYNPYHLKPNFSSDLASPVDGRVSLH